MPSLAILSTDLALPASRGHPAVRSPGCSVVEFPEAELLQDAAEDVPPPSAHADRLDLLAEQVNE